MLTRQRFGAFDREVWTIQWILTELGYDPGPIDGLWGSQTFGAVSDFRELNDLGPASDTTKAGAADQEFMVALWSQALDLEVPTAPSSGASGGTTTRPVARDTSQTRGTPGGTSTPIAAAGLDMTALLALGAVGIGAVLLSRKGR